MFPLRSKLFRVEADVVRITKHFLEDKTPFLHVAAARKTFRKPKRAHAKCSFRAGKPVGCRLADAITVNERIFHEHAVDHLQSGEPARIGWRDEFYERH